jgi:hypothetical protein
MNHKERITELNGKSMDIINFSEFVKELTGATFEEVYKEYLNNGDNDVQRENNLE